MNQGRVRVTAEMLAASLFPGANVEVADVYQTPEDKEANTYTLKLQGSVFKPVPEGADVPLYSCELWRQYRNGQYETTVVFT